MSLFVFKLPDLGEGTVEAELLAWHVKPGDPVAEDQIIAEVMTDKAAVELPAPVAGRVVSTTGSPGDMVPVGAALIVFETGAGGAAAAQEQVPAQAVAFHGCILVSKLSLDERAPDTKTARCGFTRLIRQEMIAEKIAVPAMVARSKSKKQASKQDCVQFSAQA